MPKNSRTRGGANQNGRRDPDRSQNGQLATGRQPVCLKDKINPSQAVDAWLGGLVGEARLNRPLSQEQMEEVRNYAVWLFHAAASKDPVLQSLQAHEAQGYFGDTLPLSHDGLRRSCKIALDLGQFLPSFSISEYGKNSQLVAHSGSSSGSISIPFEQIFGAMISRVIMRYIAKFLERPAHQWPLLHHSMRAERMRNVIKGHADRTKKKKSSSPRVLVGSH